MSDRSLGAVVGETPEIGNIYRIIHMASKTTHPVLIVGEPGTGKEVIARAIHSSGAHRRMAFRVRNCMTVRAIDLERELVPPGEALNGVYNVECGTLFLDQILDLNLELQGILLRSLQRGESDGYEQSNRHAPRIIAASTRDLQTAVNRGVFRRDLYFRLNALSLRVPPLRERRRDIPQLAASLLNGLSRAARRQFRLSDGALRAMLTYDWPGNVRELEKCIERACCSASSPIITVLDLPVEVTGTSGTDDVEFAGVRVVPLSELEKRSIEETLKLVRGDKLTAAKLLGIGKTTLYRKLKEYESERHSQ